MKKSKFTLKTMTDIKVFLLFLLDNIRYPIDRTTLIRIVSENTDEIVLDYNECLYELADTGHVYADEIDGEGYYMISDEGHMVASELYESLDPEFREASLRSVSKYQKLESLGTKVKATVEETSDHRFRLALSASDARGEHFRTEVVFSSRAEAERVRDNFLEKPDTVYRGILFAVSGRLGFLS